MEGNDILYIDISEVLGDSTEIVYNDDVIISDALSSSSNTLKELAGVSDNNKISKHNNSQNTNNISCNNNENPSVDVIQASKKHSRRKVMRE